MSSAQSGSRGRAETVRDSRPSRKSRLGGRRVLGSGAFLGGIAFAVLLAAPFAAASGSVSFAAPYTSFTSTMSNYLSSYGCGAVAVEHGAPSWAASTGTFTMGAQTRVSGCTLTSSSGYISGSASVTSPAFAAPHRGLNVVTAVWNTSVVAHAALTISATGAYGGAYASVGAAAYLYLYDVTGGNFTFVAYTYTTLFGATFYSNGSYSLTTGWSTSYQYLYATLHHGHTYEVQVYILATAYVSVYSATASAAASFNLGGSHGVTLESVSVV